MTQLPKWVIFHVPHDSTVIPSSVRHQFVLDDEELRMEVIKMTDHLTLKLFTQSVPENQIVHAPVSRLVVDVERFEADENEPMALSGMGIVYERTSSGNILRGPITNSERQSLIEIFYRPHHERLASMTQQLLQQFGRALLIDAHSFPSVPLPYEADQRDSRAEICIGADDFHTPPFIRDAFMTSFRDAGFDIRLNEPFSGALVPLCYYQSEPRVNAVMIEVNRSLYIDETNGHPNENFESVAASIRQCMQRAIEHLK